MGRTKIEWTATYHPDGSVTPGYTFNPWIGCQKVSLGCKNCYAERDFTRKPRWANAWGPYETSERIRTSDANWRKPLQWNRQAEADGRRYKVFCASLGDVFEDNPNLMDWRADLWDLIEITPHLDWLLLTKRPENVKAMTRRWYEPLGRYPDNLWLGVSAEDQQAADERIPLLLRTPAAVRFVSAEPLLGPVDLDPRWLPDPHGPAYNIQVAWGEDTHTLNWVIAGGESGPHARPCHPDWVRRLRDQCQETGVAFFMKQWGEWIPVGQEPPGTFIERDRGFLASVKRGHRIEYLDSAGKFRDTNELENFKLPSDWIRVARVGKKAAGRLLDDVEFNEMPNGERP